MMKYLYFVRENVVEGRALRKEGLPKVECIIIFCHKAPWAIGGNPWCLREAREHEAKPGDWWMHRVSFHTVQGSCHSYSKMNQNCRGTHQTLRRTLKLCPISPHLQLFASCPTGSVCVLPPCDWSREITAVAGAAHQNNSSSESEATSLTKFSSPTHLLYIPRFGWLPASSLRIDPIFISWLIISHWVATMSWVLWRIILRFRVKLDCPYWMWSCIWLFFY